MAYKKWVANVDRHNDWTTELVLEDGTKLKMGEPVELSAEQVNELESQRVFEDSSASEAKEYREGNVVPLVGRDVAGSAPVFENAGPSNQQAAEKKRGDTDQDDKK